MQYTRFCPSTLDIVTHPHLKHVTKCWQTTDGVYTILYDFVGGYHHLRIRRRDNLPVHNYMHLQEIKNDLLGQDSIAIEVYPVDSDFKDGSNTYHLWSKHDIQVPNLAELYEYNTNAIDTRANCKEIPAISNWTKYSAFDDTTWPKKHGKYLIVRKDGKMHWETWNGSGWAYNGNVIVMWAYIVNPLDKTVNS